jgi:cytochrome bd-type quinol oxidase subunit 2
MTRTREAAVALAVAVVSVATMAIDHLFGTEGDDSWPVDPVAFFISTAIALVLIVVLFRYVVAPTRSDPDRAGKRALLYGVLAVVTVPLLFLAIPFPFAGAATALGLIGRDGRHRRRATAGVVIGALVVVLGLGAYVGALVA